MKIEVENLRLRAYIGFQKWETDKLQDVVISFSFKYDAVDASKQDDVAYAVNYKPLTKEVIALVDGKTFDLIETLAEHVYETIVSYHDNIEAIEVCVEKPHALRFADNVMVKIAQNDRTSTAIVSLGSNIDPENHFSKALDYLTRLGIIVKRTAFITTKPLKFEDQPDFLNGAVLLHTTLSKRVLQMKLKEIEALMGRVRSANKNAPRVIDLDVLSFNNVILDPEELEELPFLKDFVSYLKPEILTAE